MKEGQIYYSGAWRNPNANCSDCQKPMYTKKSKPYFRCGECRKQKKTKEGRVTCTCTFCGSKFDRTRGEVKTNARSSVTGNVFCNSSCAASYNNRNKTYGIRRSKLEKLFEDHVRKNYPNLIIECNTTSAIGYELDLYFPELRLAVEVNGIFHYEPIYGEDKFKRIKYNDKQKVLLCEQSGIELIVVPYIKYLSKARKQEYLKTFDDILRAAYRRV